MDTTAIIRAALHHEATADVDALVTNQHVDLLANGLAQAFDELGYVLKAKPKPRAAKPAAEPEPLIPTGDAALDTFIEKHHRPDWRQRLKKALQPNRPGMIPMPPAPSFPGQGPAAMTQQRRADLYREHNVIQHSA